MKKPILALSAAGIVCVAGCSSPPPPPPPEPVYVPAVNVLEGVDSLVQATGTAWKMVEMDPTFSSMLAVSQVNASRTKDGFKSIHVQVKNLSTTPVRAAYRFEWTGADGIRVVDPYHDTWETKTFLPGDEGEFSSIAPKKECEDYKLRFRAIQ
jgi:uncharacterized protein YcfL